MSKPMNPYQKTQVTTASREQILLMLYEACIKHLRRAADAIVKKDYSAKGVAVGKAHDIINELLNTLDFKVGGDVAKNLEGLYSFMIREIVEGNLKNDPEKFNAVRKLMENLYDGWKQAVAQVNAEKNK